MKLDKTKPFGTVCGSKDRRRYEQDGRFFDVHGKEIVDGLAEAKALADTHMAAAIATLKELPPASTEADAQVAAQLADAPDAPTVGIDLDGDGKVDVLVKDGKVTKAKGKRK